MNVAGLDARMGFGGPPLFADGAGEERDHFPPGKGVLPSIGRRT